MKVQLKLVCSLVLLVVTSTGFAQQVDKQVFINGKPVSGKMIQQLETVFGVVLCAGASFIFDTQDGTFYQQEDGAFIGSAKDSEIDLTEINAVLK